MNLAQTAGREPRWGKSKAGGRDPIKMLKMKIDPEMYMKTKGRVTRLPLIIRAFVPGLHHFYKNRQQSIGLLGRKCTDYAVIGSKLERGSAQWLPGPLGRRRGGAVLKWSD